MAGISHIATHIKSRWGLPGPEPGMKTVLVLHPDTLDTNKPTELEVFVHDLPENSCIVDIIRQVEQTLEVEDIVLDYNGEKVYGEETLKDLCNDTFAFFYARRWALAAIRAQTNGSKNANIMAKITRSVKAIDEIQAIMKLHTFSSEKQFLRLAASITEARHQTKPVIGIVGPTGAGKSSLIESLLGIRGIIPSHCFRARTAVPTYISYNNSSRMPYSASIEYVSRADFFKALMDSRNDILRAELDENGQPDPASQDLVKEAWTRLREIFPHLKIEHLEDFHPINFLGKNTSLLPLLGTKADFDQCDMKDFVSVIGEETQPTVSYQFEEHTYSGKGWPLIKTIRLKLHTRILETGVTFVDLPGVGDTNNDRSHVWQSCIQECTAIWIVTPIVRAGHQQDAHKLLSESLKRQLQLDGTLFSVSFVCTKTDDLNAASAWVNLGLNVHYGPYKDYIQLLEAPLLNLRNELEQKKKECKEIKPQVKKVQQSFKNALKAGSPRKRKYGEAGFMHLDLTATELSPELEILEEEQNIIEATQENLEQRVVELEAQIEAHKRTHGRATDEAWLTGVQTRNAMQKEQLRTSFRQTLERLHVPGNIDDIIDKVSIFTVSASEAQSILNREASRMRRIEDTEIPQLRQYCQELPNTISDKWLNCMCSRINVFFDVVIPWALRSPVMNEQAHKQNDAEVQQLRSDINKRTEILQGKMLEAMDAVGRLATDLINKLCTRAKSASSRLLDLAEGWHTKLNYNTYAAIIRRKGCFLTGSTGQHDWIARISELIWDDETARAWQHVFDPLTGLICQTIIPLRELCHIELDHFKNAITAHAATTHDKPNVNSQYYRRLANIGEKHRNSISEMLHKYESALQVSQKEANRAINVSLPEVLDSLFEETSAHACTGAGSFVRMKLYFINELATRKDRIFSKGLDMARGSLRRGMSKAEGDLIKAFEDLEADIDEDIRYVFIVEGEDIVRRERKVRNEVAAKLRAGGFVLEEVAVVPEQANSQQGTATVKPEDG